MKQKKFITIFLITLTLFMPVSNAKAISNVNTLKVNIPGIGIKDCSDTSKNPCTDDEKQKWEESQNKGNGDNINTDDDLGLCSDPNFLRLILYVKQIISIITIGAALVLVITGMITIAKTVTDEKADLSKSLKIFMNKILIAVLIFLLPAIMNWLFFSNNFFTSKNETLSKCANNLDIEKIEELENKKNNSSSSGSSGSGHDNNSSSSGSSGSEHDNNSSSSGSSGSGHDI